MNREGEKMAIFICSLVVMMGVYAIIEYLYEKLSPLEVINGKGAAEDANGKGNTKEN